MRILVACEFSGRVRDAFTRKGHEAWSCDLEPSELPGNHIIGDVYSVLDADWDMMIAFPPCTYLARSGARWYSGSYLEERALTFAFDLINADIPRVAVENPIGAINSLAKPDQIIQPWQFGHGETKATCLWLTGLPKLTPTNVVDGRVPRVHYEPPGPERTKNRSRTYQGIADAMAEQWTI